MILICKLKFIAYMQESILALPIPPPKKRKPGPMRSRHATPTISSSCRILLPCIRINVKNMENTLLGLQQCQILLEKHTPWMSAPNKNLVLTTLKDNSVCPLVEWMD